MLLYESLSPNTFPTKKVIVVPQGAISDFVLSLEIDDSDQDGNKEILFIDDRTGLKIYECTGDDSYALVYRLGNEFGYMFEDFITGDFDGDGKIEIVLGATNVTGSPENGYIVILENIGDNTYEKIFETEAINFGGFELEKGHFSGDKLQFVVFGEDMYTNGTTDRIQIYESDDNHSNPPYQAIYDNQFNKLPPFSTGGISVGNLDQDRFDEIILKLPNSSGNNVMTLYKLKKFSQGYQLERIWQHNCRINPGQYLNPENPTISDTDKDGKPEIIFEEENALGKFETKVYEYQE